MTALKFVNEIYQIGYQNKKVNFFYIGDYDVYGIDIMLNYAIGTIFSNWGNESFQGLWS